MFRTLLTLAFLSVLLVSALAQSPEQAVSLDLLITNATIITMNADRHVIENGALATKGDKIIYVSRENNEIPFPKGVIAKQTIDAHGKLLLPGFINAHTHVPMSLLRGLKDDVVLDDWLKNYIFPAEAKNVTEDFVRWGTRLAAAEQIRSGVTTFADMYYFEDAIAEETKAAGMRAVLGETFIDFPAPDNKTHDQLLAYSEKFLQRWRNDPLIHAAVAPHSIYTDSEQTLIDAATLARKYNSPILIHVAEIKKELDESLAANPVYKGNCAKCHGKTAEGRHFGGPSLISERTAVISTEDLHNIIANGKGHMPKFAGKLTSEEIDTLVQEIQALNRK
jgi:5-methylthioadenosine/S-adenosylhomocysteine deaminase